MFTARKKIVKERAEEPDELEEQVAQVRNNATYTEKLSARQPGANQSPSASPLAGSNAASSLQHDILKNHNQHLTAIK